MPWTLKHLAWLKDTGERLTPSDGKIVEVCELCHKKEKSVLSAWAKHFENLYCSETKLVFWNDCVTFLCN